MFDKPFKVEIITPERVLFSGDVLSISAPGVEGGFQVLFNHAPLLSALEVGAIKVTPKEGKEFVFAASGGFLEVRQNLVVVLAETAEREREIDVPRAQAARERAEQRLKSRGKDTDVERAQYALLRALNRLRVADRAS
jgi:F-type H+-transporting ATPase subunit epsilon